jgi:RNA polymerase primary sigma factor
MYMREMGTVELLTREGEIEIAKRIEGGLMDMMEAISASPATIAEILNMAEEIREGKVVISTVVDGFVNANEADDYVAEEDFDEYDEEDDDDGKGGSKALTKKLEELKNEALGASTHARAVRQDAQGLRQGRLRHRAYMKVQKAITEELMTIRFTAKTIEKLCDWCAPRWTTCARRNASCARSSWTSAACRRSFIKDFPPNLLNLDWVKQAAAGKPYSAVLERNIPPVQELQQNLIDLQARVVVPLEELKHINKRMNEANAPAATPRRK